MDIELLVVADCPHEQAATTLLRRALNDVGLDDVDFKVRVIANEQQAAAAHFVGSPTFHIGGRDPFSSPGAPSGVACRLYATSTGLSGVPGIEPLRRALKAAADPAGCDDTRRSS